MADNREETVGKIELLASELTHGEGIEIVEVQLLGGGAARVLRITIDKPGGVSHADCELVTHRVGEAVDAADLIPGEASYTLEVTSPGLERKLLKPRDFERFRGQKVKIALKKARGTQKRFEGKLASFEADVVTLELDGGTSIQVPLAEIEKANLKHEW